MTTWTYSDLNTKVRQDMGITYENFISATGMRGYFKEAVRKLEKLIHGTYEDYFLAHQTVTLVNGTAEYDLASDIFVNKIRYVLYANGTTIYPIKKLRGEHKFYDAEQRNLNDSGAYYKYLIKNRNVTDGVKLQLFPAAYESGAYITIWYLRKLNELTSDSSVFDAPEFVDYVINFVKLRCSVKEHDTVLMQARNIALKECEKELNNTLENMIPDGDNEILPDMAIYDDMV